MKARVLHLLQTPGGITFSGGSSWGIPWVARRIADLLHVPESEMPGIVSLLGQLQGAGLLLVETLPCKEGRVRLSMILASGPTGNVSTVEVLHAPA